MTTETLQTIRTIIASECHLAESGIEATSGLEALGIDSLGAIEILFRIEDEFNIRIPQDRSGVRLDTVQDLIDIVERLMAEQSAG